MIAKHFKANPLHAPRLHWKLLAFAVLLAVACPSLYQWELHRETKRKAEYDQFVAANRKRSDEAVAQIRNRSNVRTQRADKIRQLIYNPILPGIAINAAETVLGKWYSSWPTRQDAEACLNHGRPFETTRVSRDFGYGPQGPGPHWYDMALYTPPDGGPEIRLYFQDRILIHTEGPSLPEFKPSRPIKACSWLCELFQKWGSRLWMPMLILPFILRRHRVILAETLTALSVLLVVSFIPSAAAVPDIQAWRSLGQYPDVAWAMFMASTSVTVLVWALLRQSNVCRILCPLCGYNLRGNTAECCPECGTAVPKEIRERLAAFPIKPLSQTV